jgi:hypothetical protein
MRMSSVEIAPYRPRWAGGVAQLQQETWSADLARNRQYLAWKYRDNSIGARLWVARDGGEVIGLRGAVGLRWQKGATRLLSLSPTDAMVRPDRRRQGLFAAMIDAMVAATADVPLVSLSSQIVSSAGDQERGWRVVGSWRLAHRLLPHRREPSLATPFAVLDGHAGATLPGPIVIERRPRAAQMAALVARLSAREGRRARLGLLRDRRFYRWRYANPLAHYRFVFLGDQRLRGFAVLQLPHRSTQARANVVEWEGETPLDKALVLEAAMTWGDFAGLAVWNTHFADDEQAILARLGFGLFDHRSADRCGLHCPEIRVRHGRSSTAIRRLFEDGSRWQLPGIASDQF